MATKSDSKSKKVEKRSAKKVGEALQSSNHTETSQPDETECRELQETVNNIVQADTSHEPVHDHDEPTLTELIVESYSGCRERGCYHGKGQATFAGGHEYKGEFCEGYMHGKGCYKWCDGVIYEGDFSRNQVTGKGLYQWPDGSSYEGDVLCGKRHGSGTFKCNNNMLYSGDWAMGKRHGKGRMEYDGQGKSFYEGQWVNNVRHGWGTRQYPSGNIYQGMWFNNVRHGEGTMKWIDKEQIYSGQWENGIQHGMGQHIWLLKRVHGSQYPLRNMFDGELVNGLRHGYGTFYYANGAKYEGGWKNNMKHGKGKFTFKNGRIYEGMFEKDHIVEYPEFTMDGGTTSPDLSNIRTRTPLPLDNVSVHSNESRNTVSPSFQLELNFLLNEFDESDRDEEASQVLFAVTRHITNLRRIYSFYSALGNEESPDNTFVMNKMQFWRFLKDTRLHHKEKTIADMDRILELGQQIETSQAFHTSSVDGHKMSNAELHSPYERILQRQFINNLIVLAYHLYKKDHSGSTPKLAWCMSRLISDHILRYSCNIKGHFFYEQRRAVNALVHVEQTYDIYQHLCSPRSYPPHDHLFKMREFLFMMKDLKLINNDLTPKDVIEVLASDDPNVTDGEGCYNLELEMSFLEFFEALIGCAERYITEAVVKDPSTPRPSTTITKDESMYSIPGSPSRMTSHGGADEQSEVHGSLKDGISPETASPVRVVSSAKVTTETGGEGASCKVRDETLHPSASNVTGGYSDGGQGESTSRHGSAKDMMPLGDHHQSASFFSTNTMDDNDKRLQSAISIDGHTIIHMEEGYENQGHEDDPYVEEELDEATRQFNFWTHQVHIFFVRKFLPAAENMIRLKLAVKKQIEEEQKERKKSLMADTANSAENIVEPNQVVVEEKTVHDFSNFLIASAVLLCLWSYCICCLIVSVVLLHLQLQ